VFLYKEFRLMNRLHQAQIGEAASPPTKQRRAGKIQLRKKIMTFYLQNLFRYENM